MCKLLPCRSFLMVPRENKRITTTRMKRGDRAGRRTWRAHALASRETSIATMIITTTRFAHKTRVFVDRVRVFSPAAIAVFKKRSWRDNSDRLLWSWFLFFFFIRVQTSSSNFTLSNTTGEKLKRTMKTRDVKFCRIQPRNDLFQGPHIFTVLSIYTHYTK